MSAIRPAAVAEGDPDDPRTASGKDRSLLLAGREAAGNRLVMEQRTKNTGMTVCCAVTHRFNGTARAFETEDGVCWEGTAGLKAGERLPFEKSICYTDYISLSYCILCL